MEYRFNFFIQSLFMIINNTMFSLFWFFLFQNITDINGYVMSDMIGLFGLAALIFGINSFFFGNWMEISDKIMNGEIDFYLGLPKDELTHILISKSSFSAFGDILFGIAVFILFYPLTLHSIALFIVAAIAGSIIWASLLIISGSLTFWFGNSSGVGDAMKHLTMSLTSYPLNLFKGAFKFIFLFIIPIFFINNISIQLLKEFSWNWLGGLVLVSILMITITRWIFKRGLRKYESGNLISVRT